MFSNFDFGEIWRALPYLFLDGMRFTLTLTFPKPVTFSAFALYEDCTAPGRLTDTCAVFVHRADKRDWRKVGHVVGNRSAFNLFTFDPVSVDQVVYLWLGSADGHARIAEWEGYAPDDDLL